MARKNRLFTSAPRGRQDEKLLRSWKEFSRSILGYILLVAIAAVIGRTGAYDLSRGSVNGFALWFLLLPAYLPLWIAGAFAMTFKFNIDAWFAGREALLLGGIDAAMAVLVWLAITVISFRDRRAVIPHTARNFVRMLIFWGLFQLACGAMLGLWEHGGLAGLHRDAPAKVTAPADRP